MKRAMHKLGTIFFVLVISCLLVLGCLLCINIIDNSINENNQVNLDKKNSVADVRELSPIAEEVLLDGKTCDEQAEKWSLAIEKSLEGKHILVTMYEDWIAESNSDFTMSFGEGLGLNDGRISVPPTAIITLDLNGHNIDRRLTEKRRRGQVIILYQSTLTIKDSCYDAAKVLEAYKNNPDVDLTSFGAGKITGGYEESNGAIYIEDNCNLILESGMICNNYGTRGGAIQSNGSTITINGGVINNNIASDSGGGIFSYNGSVFNMNGGIIHKNLAIGFGGGVYCSSSNCNITYGIFSYNKADTSVGEGGGLFTDATNVHITGGIYEYNTSIHCGGGIRVGGACDSVEISNIISRYNHADTYSGGVRIASSLSCEAFIKDSIIINNSAKTHGGGMTIEVQSTIGEGLQIYDNTVKDEENNLILSVGVKISGSLMKDGKNTHVGLSNYNVEITKGYTSSGNTMEPNRFFFSDKSGYIVTKSASGEVKLIEGTKPSSKITWRWGSTSTEMTTSTQVTLPYKVGGYNISIGGSSFYQNTSGINRASGTSFTIVTPGSYAFYADGNYLNSTFMVTIEPPKAEIAKPTIKKYVYVYDDRQQINFTPEGFDSTTMEISYNRTSSVGKHIAQVQLKDNCNTIWADDKTTNKLQIEYEIIHPGIVLKDSSDLDYIYLDNNYRKEYKENKLIHKVSDSEKTTTDSGNIYVIGNISANTTLTSFISNIRNDSKLLKVYGTKGELIYDGITSNGVIADSVSNTLVGTGYKVELYESTSVSTPWDIVYLSILGDINGDGRITASDVAEVREIAENSTLLNNMSLEKKLACMVDNKGSVTYVDSEILRNTINNQLDINVFFESGVNVDSEYAYLTLDKDNLIRGTSEAQTNVIGNIAVNTSVATFKEKLAVLGIDTTAITIYDRKGIVVTDNNAIVGTGWRIETGGKTIYLSVIGDLNGDGRISAADITMLRELVTINKNNITDCVLLSAIILNKGGITTADSEVLKCVIDNKVYIESY